MFEPLYQSLLRIRRFEEEVARIYPSDKIKSPVHLSIGQEFVSVGVCEALQKSDIVYGTYRGHALYLAKGGSMRAMMAELFGKVNGCARGKGGSMHLIDIEVGMMGTSAVVGTCIPNAVGHAFALRNQKSDAIVVCFFGDGATEEGVFSESLNFAALKRLPILFVCENNRYAIHTHQSRRQATLHIGERVKAHGIPADSVKDRDVLSVTDRSKSLVEKIRNGNGPQFLEVLTYRWKEHVGPGEDYHLGYRNDAEADSWHEADFRNTLRRHVDPEELQRIESAVESEIQDAIRFAEESPFPAPIELMTDVFKEV